MSSAFLLVECSNSALGVENVSVYVNHGLEIFHLDGLFLVDVNQ